MKKLLGGSALVAMLLVRCSDGVRRASAVKIASATLGSLVGVLLLLEAGSAVAPPGPVPALAASLSRGEQVYMAQCVLCHGVGGDGAGMTAHMFRVRPRDFRRGVFKFRSTPSGSLPTDRDLLRTVTEGVRWTAMVGRADLSESDRRAVVQYVETFSPRFTAERSLSPVTVPPVPEMDDALLEQGRRLYRDAECGRCHGARGRGDGPSAAGMKDVWGWPTWPSDLTWRPLKRGSSPDQIYLTIATGLDGAPMPSYGDSLTGQEIWALVWYLDSLVAPEHRLSPTLTVGDESRGWMALRMGHMMGGGSGMMGGGMMGRMPMMR